MIGLRAPTGTRLLCGAGVALALALAVCQLARAQSADLVLCDRIAADPADPDKPADVKGVADVAPSDVLTAIKFCKTASGSSRRAMYQLGRAYAANKQMPEAVAAYRRASEKGNTSAMVELGVLTAAGAGVPKDAAEARRLFQKAAEAGNPRGVTNLAALEGTAASNPTQARALLLRAAESNSAEAQYQLGLMMAEGTGGPRDDIAARSLFEKAAAQGHVEAMVWFGAFAAQGRGGPEDKDAAKAYYSKAAALGNEDAKAALKRIECPYVLKDKRGNIVSNLCF